MKPKGNKLAINGNDFPYEADECLKWLSLDEVKNNPKVFPIFYREKLSEFPEEIMHFIVDEREEE